MTIKDAGLLYENFQTKFGGIAENRISLHQALWLYNTETKDL
jgi:hypothetical protein